MSSLILGIETSCDETAAAVVASGRRVLSDVVASQICAHKSFGGVVPELAARLHVDEIDVVTKRALAAANAGLSDLTAIAVTSGPGLVGALHVGVSFAKALALSAGLPLVPVHHLAGHVAANYLGESIPELPFICLIVSGGHTHLVIAEERMRFRVLGRTRDDAAGEAFDKIARSMGLSYPGGPELSRLAELGDPGAVRLPSARLDQPLDFSFSGLKTAAVNLYNNEKERRAFGKPPAWSDADFAASVECAIVSELVVRVEKAVEKTGIKQVAIAGGVAANRRLRSELAVLSAKKNFTLFIPEQKYCTDNAAMIASAGFFAYLDGVRAEDTLAASAVAEIGC